MLTEQVTICTVYKEFTLEMELQRYILRKYPHFKFWSKQCTWNPHNREWEQCQDRNLYCQHHIGHWILPIDSDMLLIGSYDSFLQCLDNCPNDVVWIPIYDKDMCVNYFPAVIKVTDLLEYRENHHTLYNQKDQDIYKREYPHSCTDLVWLLHLGEYYK